MAKRYRRRRIHPLHYDAQARLSSHRFFDRLYIVVVFLVTCFLTWMIFWRIIQ